MSSPVIELLIQLGALGLLAFVIWYLLVRAVPGILASIKAMQTEFIRAMKEQDDKFTAELRFVREQFSTDLREMQRINIESHVNNKVAMVKAIENLTEVTQQLRLEINKWKKAG